MLLLIDNYDSFTHNLHHILSLHTDHVKIIRNDQFSLDSIEKIINQYSIDGIVLSPGPGRPEEAGIILPVIEKYLGKIPLLGVCLGHQAMGMVFGGKVIKATEVLHGKSSLVLHNSRGLYKGLKEPFLAARYHSLCIDAKSLDKNLVDAKTVEGTIMGISDKKLRCYGMQYHPESVLTKVGGQLIQNFVKISLKN